MLSAVIVLNFKHFSTKIVVVGLSYIQLDNDELSETKAMEMENQQFPNISKHFMNEYEQYERNTSVHILFTLCVEIFGLNCIHISGLFHPPFLTYFYCYMYIVGLKLTMW